MNRWKRKEEEERSLRWWSYLLPLTFLVFNDYLKLIPLKENTYKKQTDVR